MIHDDPHDGSRPLELSADRRLRHVMWSADIKNTFPVRISSACQIPVGHERQVGAVSTGKCDRADGGADDADAHRLKT